jgi:hypothetical protein
MRSQERQGNGYDAESEQRWNEKTARSEDKTDSRRNTAHGPSGPSDRHCWRTYAEGCTAEEEEAQCHAAREETDSQRRVGKSHGAG